MKKMKLLGIFAFILFISSGAAVDSYGFKTLEDGKNKVLFGDSDQITFQLNVSDNQDYNLTVKDSDGVKQVNDAPMSAVSSNYYRIYQFNYSLSSPLGGEWEAYVNYTEASEKTIDSIEFDIATDKPRIFNVKHRDAAYLGENTTVKFNVSDLQENWKNATFKFDSGTSYSLNQQETGSNYAVYTGEVTVSEEGRNYYEVNAWDTQDNHGSYTGYIEGVDNDQDSSAFDVTVQYSCGVDLENFYVPGNGTLFLGEAGRFTLELKNADALEANLTVNYLNVTYEGGEWEEGEPIGPSVKLYDNQSYYNVSSGQQVVYDRLFTKSNQSGWYTGRTEYFYECYNPYEDEYQNFTRDDYRRFEVVNTTGGVSNEGNQTTNETIAANTTEYDDAETNQTVNQDSNRTGDEGQQVEGDNQQPGITPQPEPEPEPEPEPIPQLSMDIEPLQNTYTGPPGQFIPANLSVTNEGGEPLTALTIAPQIQDRQGWETSNAQIAALGVDQTVYREVLIRTSADTDTGLYVIPVVGSNPDNELDIDYFNLNITENITVEEMSQMEIVESPRSVSVLQNSTTPLPILVENTGRNTLTNISGRLQNIGECGEVSIGSINRLETGESASLNFTFDAAPTSQSCNTTLILSSDEGVYSFSKISFTVTPEEGLIPEKYRVPFIATAWTGLLALFAVAKRRYEINSGLLKAPFVLLVAGEALIFIYLLVDYYQLVSAAFLPF